MKRLNDAQGKEFLACFRKETEFEVIERDDGYIGVSSNGKAYLAPSKDWGNHVKKALRLTRDRVLDIGCGASRHAIYLQNNGFDVTGIDTSPLALKVSRLRGLRKAKLLSIDKVDKFRPNSFDTVLMLGHNFGLFSSFKNARILLKKLHKTTSVDALIIAETMDPYKTDNPCHKEYHKRNWKLGRMGGQIRLRVRFEKHIGKWLDYLFVSKKELKQILKGTGWKIKRFFDAKKPSATYITILEKTK